MSGLTDYGEQQALIGLLVNGTDVYIGLFTVLPSADDGTGGTEASGSGYVRIDHNAWLNAAEDPITYRVNNGAIEFAALTAELAGIVGWGIWDAVTVGNMIAFGPILDASENEVSVTFPSGDQPRFITQELKVGLS